MSILKAGIRVSQSLVGDQRRRGLVGLDPFTIAATLADVPGTDTVKLTLDPDADPRLSNYAVKAQSTTTVRVDIDDALITAHPTDPYPSIELEV